MCPEMCVGTGLRACDMQPYRACSPPPPSPPPQRCCRHLPCDADQDPDLVRAHLFRCVCEICCCCCSSFCVCKDSYVRACVSPRVCEISHQTPVGRVLQIHVEDAIRQGCSCLGVFLVVLVLKSVGKVSSRSRPYHTTHTNPGNFLLFPLVPRQTDERTDWTDDRSRVVIERELFFLCFPPFCVLFFFSF